MPKGFIKGDPRAVAAGKLAGAGSARSRLLKRKLRWSQTGIDPAMAQRIYLHGYNSGYAMGRRSGWREALGEARAR